MQNSKFLTVSFLNQYISNMFEANPHLENVYLKGEISNFKWSGRHCYFSLKDEFSEISAMMFSYDNASLTFEPKDGMNVQVMGKIQVYQKKGTYAIIVKKMTADGLGLLYQEYLELKDKLFKEGLFDQKHKLPLPEYPNVVAVITSPTGDAVRDVISTFNRRLPLARIIVYPALVQGKDAPKDLIRALKQVYKDNLADAIIIGRGGGSFEDLSCFNDEELARTLFASPIPTVSGIGHEADYTICDFVSSYRAPTPTGAAIALTKEKNDCYNLLNIKATRIKNALINVLTTSFKKYDALNKSYGLTHFDELLEGKYNQYKVLTSKLMENSPSNLLNIKYQHLEDLDVHLTNYYNININNRNNQLDVLNEKLKPTIITHRIDKLNDNINYYEQSINKNINYYLDNLNQQLENLIKKIIILNPLNTMERGYAVVYQDNNIISKLSNLDLDKNISIEMVDGKFDASIIKESIVKR